MTGLPSPRLGGSSLVRARGAQHVAHRVVAFMARVLVHPTCLRLEIQRHSPRGRPCLGVNDREFVSECLGVHAPEAFDETLIAAAAPIRHSLEKSGGLDDEGIALP